MRPGLLVLAALLLLAPSLESRGLAAQTGLPPAPPPPPIILRQPASVRTAGLAGAGAAVVGYAGSIFTNPSGLATIGSLSAEGAYARFPDRSTNAMGAVALRLGQFDFGAGLQVLEFSDTSATDRHQILLGSVVYRVGLTAVGASLKYLSIEDTSGTPDRAITTDIGLTLAVFDIMALAVSVQNLGRDVVSGIPLSLPTTTHIGFTLNFVDPQSQARLLGTIETIWTEGEPRRTLLGGEAGVVLSGVGLVGRVGHGGQPEGSGHSKWAYGASVVLGQFRLDWAYQAETAFGGGVHRFGARWTP